MPCAAAPTPACHIRESPRVPSPADSLTCESRRSAPTAAPASSRPWQAYSSAFLKNGDADRRFHRALRPESGSASNPRRDLTTSAQTTQLGRESPLAFQPSVDGGNELAGKNRKRRG